MIVKASKQVSTRSTKLVNIQAHEYLNLKLHIHLTVQLPLDLTTIIKACMSPSIELLERFDLQAYRYIVDQVCSHVVKNKSYLGVTLNLYVAIDQESIQSYDH